MRSQAENPDVATLAALRRGLELAEKALRDLSCYRERAHAYDDDMGARPRVFDDAEYWAMMESDAGHAADRARSALAVVLFNDQHPIGTPVAYWSGTKDGPGVESRTRTAAVLDAASQAVVWVDGSSSCIALSHVEPREGVPDRGGGQGGGVILIAPVLDLTKGHGP